MKERAEPGGEGDKPCVEGSEHEGSARGRVERRVLMLALALGSFRSKPVTAKRPSIRGSIPHHSLIRKEWPFLANRGMFIRDVSIVGYPC